MKSKWFALILVALFAASGNTHSLAQTPEKLYQKDLTQEKGDIEAYQRLETNSLKPKNEFTIAKEKLNRSTWKQPHLNRIGAALSSGTESFLLGVLQFLKTAGKSLLTNGILTILIIFILLMLIFNLHVSYTNKREWKYIL